LPTVTIGSDGIGSWRNARFGAVANWCDSLMSFIPAASYSLDFQ
jgi:hypothetical protein